MITVLKRGDGFIQQPQVANGASELLLEIFGESGRHVRVNSCVEVELVVEV